MAYLLIKGSKTGQRALLKAGKNVIGRHEKCDVVIDDSFLKSKDRRTDSVSRRHAVITSIDDKFYLEDGDGSGKASRNGTFVNNVRIQTGVPAEIKDGDRIRFGDVEMTFRTG